MYLKLDCRRDHTSSEIGPNRTVLRELEANEHARGSGKSRLRTAISYLGNRLRETRESGAGKGNMFHEILPP